MIYSNDEAIKYWCPHTRMTWANMNELGDGWRTTGDPSFNAFRLNRSDDERRETCIGSLCSQFRMVDEKRGYCGLAGVPHHALGPKPKAGSKRKKGKRHERAHSQTS